MSKVKQKNYPAFYQELTNKTTGRTKTVAYNKAERLLKDLPRDIHKSFFIDRTLGLLNMSFVFNKTSSNWSTK